jgi:AcrR family transcriptional regulator
MQLTKKDIIVRTLLNIASENGKLTIEEISKHSNIPRITIKKHFKNGISDIVESVYLDIVREVNEKLFTYDVDELSLETFSDILLPVLWIHRDPLHIIYSSQLPFPPLTSISQETWDWAGQRFDNLAKKHGLYPSFSGFDLLKYFNACLISILTMWLGQRIPIDIELFRPKFLFLMSNSLDNLIYRNIF